MHGNVNMDNNRGDDGICGAHVPVDKPIKEIETRGVVDADTVMIGDLVEDGGVSEEPNTKAADPVGSDTPVDGPVGSDIPVTGPVGSDTSGQSQHEEPIATSFEMEA